MQEFPEMLRQLRTRCGITQSQLAQQLGCSQRTISKWEAGEGMPRINLVVKLAAALGVPAETFTRLDAPETPNLQEPKALDLSNIPSYGRVDFARFAWPAGEEIDQREVGADLYRPGRFLLRAGDSSMEPEIHRGDVCIFAPTARPAPENVVCCRIHSDRFDFYTVRLYVERESLVELRPVNLASGLFDTLILVRGRGRKYALEGVEVDWSIRGVMIGLIRTYEAL